MSPQRVIASVGVLTLVVAAGLWAAAIGCALRREGPALFLLAPPEATPSETWPAYAFAIWPDERRRLPLEGIMTAGQVNAPLVAGYGAVRLSSDQSEIRVALAGHVPRPAQTIAAAYAVQLDVTVPLRAPRTQQTTLRFRPWTEELLERTAVNLRGPPVYPLHGTLSGALPDELLTLGEEGPVMVPLSPNAALMRAPDGRTLHIDRSGLALELPLVAAPGTPVEVALLSTDPRSVHLELVLNGRVVALFGASLQQGRNLVPVPHDVPPEEGWIAVRVFSSPLDRATSLEAVAWRWRSVDTPAALLERLSQVVPFAGANDPLLRALRQHPPQTWAPLRALVARVAASPSVVTNVAPSVREQREASGAAREEATHRYRRPFRIVGGVFSLFAGLVALGGLRATASLRERRGAWSVERGALSWAALAAAAALAVIGVLDWVIGFSLGDGFR